MQGGFFTLSRFFSHPLFTDKPYPSTVAKSLSKVDTIYSADSLEFSPHHPRIFVVGTYQLEPAQPVVAEASIARTSVLDGEEGEDGEVEVEMVTPAAKRKGRLLVYEADKTKGTMYVAFLAWRVRRRQEYADSYLCSGWSAVVGRSCSGSRDRRSST
jgi:hypothetical protein